MMSFAHEEPRLSHNHRKLLVALLKKACARCYSSGDKARAPLSSSSEEETPYSDLDNKHIIILAIQSRALRAKAQSKSGSYGESLCWVFSPTSGKLLIAPKGQHEVEDDEAGGDDDDETETYFSVKSYFSRCSSDDGMDPKVSRRRLILEELSHCEGWPFGLWRKAIVLPPLPSSPSDSWTWHKRNLVAKIYTTISAQGFNHGKEQQTI